MASKDTLDSESLVSSKVVESPATESEKPIQINDSHITNNNDAQQPNKNNTNTTTTAATTATTTTEAETETVTAATTTTTAATSHANNTEQRLPRKRKRFVSKSVEKGSNISDLDLHEADDDDRDDDDDEVDNDEISAASASENEGFHSPCSITSDGSLKKKKKHAPTSPMFMDHKDIQIDSEQNNSDDEAEANITIEFSENTVESKEIVQLDDKNNTLADDEIQDNQSNLDKPSIITSTKETELQSKIHLLVNRQDDDDDVCDGVDESEIEAERTTLKYLGHLSETDKQSQDNSNFSYHDLSATSNLAVSTLNCISSQVEEAFHVLQHQYMAPEQALVTNVELVVPPSNNFNAYDGCRPQSVCTSSSDAKTTIAPANLDLEEIKQQTCDTALRNEHISVPVGVNEANISSGSIWTPHSGYKHLFVQQLEQDNTRSNSLQSPRNRLEQKILQNTVPAAQATKNYAQLFGTENFRLHQQQQQEMLQNFKREGLHRYPQMLHMPHYSPHHDHQNRQQQHQLQTQTPELYAQVNTQYGSYVPTHPHQHYAHEPLFGMHHTQEQQSHQHQHISQGHMHLDQSTNIQPQHRQQHSQQLQEVYQDLLIDEFQENPNASYKLGLSPSNVKAENQDDGYETCAGDVLTPNSHSSSTHSVTPQHQMQHGLIGVTNSNNVDQQQQQPSLLLNTKPNATTTGHPHVLQLNEHQINESVNCGISNERGENIGNSSYNFIDDEIHIMSPAPQSGVVPTNSSVYIAPLENGQSSNSHVFNMKHQQIQQQLIMPDAIVGMQQHQMSMPAGNSGDNLNTVNVQEQSEHQKHQVHITATDLNTKPLPKRRGRKKKVNDLSFPSSNILGIGNSVTEMNSETNTSMSVPGILKAKERKKHDRFNGMSEDEVVKRTIPDHLCENLDIVIVGINPSLFAAYKGHHYAGPGNHFWKCIYLSGLSQEQMSADEDYKLLKQGIGFTNMVSRATKGSADLTRKEIKEGSRILLEKLQQFRPKIAVFNGKLIFEVFSGKKDFNFGRQPECVEGTDTYIWVMPSSSARCAQLPRAADKVPFYAALKKFRDYLNGLISHIDESECVFTEQRIKLCCEQVATSEQTQSESVCNSRINFLYNDSRELKPQDKMMMETHYGRNAENSTGSGYVSAYDATETMHMVGHPHGHLGRTPIINECYGIGGTQFDQQATSKQTQEKKKRGRPKKVRGQELPDGTILNKVVVSNAQQQQQHDFNNILNLSVVGSVITSGDEAPKKKRGRPKKQKVVMQGESMQKSLPIQQQSNLVSIHTLRMEHTASPQQQQQHQSLQSQSQNQSLYNTPPPSHTIMYNTSASPMPSPAINCTYTPPVSVQVTPPQTTSLQSLNSSPTEQIVTSHLVPDIIKETHLGETPPPNSPNICSVDFETASNNNAHNSQQEQQKCDHQQQMNTQSQHHRLNSDSRYASPVNEITNENHYPLWKQQIQSQSPVAHFGTHNQQQHLKYQEAATQQWQRQHEQHQHQQQQQQQQEQQQQQQHQHHSYEDLDNQYLLSPQQDSSARPEKQQPHLASSDVARKSLSGLESLVEQIPSINESESNAMSTAAAAAAVERRLLGLEQQQQPTGQDGHEAEHFVVTNTSNSINNSSFSVSNLAASSSTPTATNNDAIGCHLTTIHQATQNAEYGQSDTVDLPSSGAYHHPNIISAALAVAAAQPPTAASPTAHHVTTHPQMYMDPTHMPHMAHVPVNSMYGPPVGTPHHPHPHSHSHGNHFPSAYGQSVSEHNNGVTGDYGAYSQSAATLHMPSPNYPYAHYGHASAQSNYVGVGYAHTHTHPHAHTHHPLPHHGHTAHHLSVFERLKPSDIGSYSGF